MKNTLSGLKGLLRSLPEVFPFDPNRIVLVGDGHGAVGATDLTLTAPDRVRALVLVNAAGGLATPQLRKLLALPIMVIPGHGRRFGASAIERLRIYSRKAGKKEGEAGLQNLDDRKWPWCLALPLPS